jgi:hypothetical protein
MALTHTTPSPEDSLSKPIPASVANAQNAALDLVLPHLEGLGVNAQLVKRLLVQCQTMPDLAVEPLWYPPQLIIHADGGRKVATVTLGVRSGSYVVEVARVGDDNEPLADRMRIVPVNKPEKVALEIALSMRQPT